MTALERLGQDEMAIRAENSRRILAEHGVTCFVSRPDGSKDQPWRIDLTPLVIDSGEWRKLEAGLVQRATLLNRILGDLYGTQHLVRDGFVPAPLVFANPAYLRACQAIQVPDGIYLQTYAVDLARSPDGSWWVLADRAQTPAGLGFALENRSVLSRVLPEALHEVQPRPISDTLRIRRETLRRCAAHDSESPSIVLLTPGPRNEAYFEHTYLARLLGLALVEGDDLTVRDRKLFIKTLDGLRHVDVVLRKVNDAFCDPLELRGDSLLGVPGLVEVARAGNVRVGNALGSGLVESPSFLPFLPGLCRYLLEEDLLLPSLATWWCGQAREQSYVREHLEELVIRSAFTLQGTAIRPAELNAADRTALLEKLRMRPHEFVGQERIRLSRVPLWGGKPSESAPFVLRAFVLHDGQRFTVMPGGLLRVAEEESWTSSLPPLSVLSKDVWVLQDGQTETCQPIVLASHLSELKPAPSNLPSRTADNFFWLGRYTERLEQLVRVARYVLGYLAEDSTSTGNRLRLITRLLTRLGLMRDTVEVNPSRERLQKQLLLLLFQEECNLGVRDLLKRIHLAAFSVRDRLSADTWRILNRLEPDAHQRPGRLPLAQALTTLHTLVLDLGVFSGMAMENMTRGRGWSFLDIGRRVERGLSIARLMEAVLRSGDGVEFLLEPALEIADSVMTHRHRYFSELRLHSTIEVLIHDSTNPRSLAFQIESLARHAVTLPAGTNPEGVEVLQGRITQLAEKLRRLEDGNPAEDPLLADALFQLAQGLGDLSDLLTQVYFSHVTPQVN